MTGGGPAGPSPGPKVTLYGRPGCHLCEDALAVIEEVRSRVAFELEQRDIESDEGWFKRYLERIPVVELEGREVFELFVDARRFEQMLIDRK
jgi:CBS domain containing-hemolysin-like protein